MSRSLTAAVEAEVVKSRIKPFWLVYLGFDSGAVRLFSGIGTISWNGNTYTGAGTLGRISPIEETSDVRSNGVQLSLSGISSSLISTALGEEYQGRTCTIWLGFLDSSDALIADPVQMFSGKLDVMSIVDSGDTCDITVTAENRLVDLERPSEVRYYADADQKRYSTGDRGCEFVETLQTKDIVWGRVRSSPASSPAPQPATAPAASPVESNYVEAPSGMDAPGSPDGGGGDNGTGGFGDFTV